MSVAKLGDVYAAYLVLRLAAELYPDEQDAHDLDGRESSVRHAAAVLRGKA